jgi:hypothetical protein
MVIAKHLQSALPGLKSCGGGECSHLQLLNSVLLKVLFQKYVLSIYIRSRTVKINMRKYVHIKQLTKSLSDQRLRMRQRASVLTAESYCSLIATS